MFTVWRRVSEIRGLLSLSLQSPSNRALLTAIKMLQGLPVLDLILE